MTVISVDLYERLCKKIEKWNMYAGDTWTIDRATKDYVSLNDEGWKYVSVVWLPSITGHERKQKNRVDSHGFAQLIPGFRARIFSLVK